MRARLALAGRAALRRLARLPRAVRWSAVPWAAVAAALLLPTLRRALVTAPSARGAAAIVLVAAAGLAVAAARRVRRDTLARIRADALHAAAPLALLLTLAAGGPGSSGIVIAALWLVGAAWSAAPRRALALAGAALALVGAGERIARGTVSVADVVFAAPLLAAGALAPAALRGASEHADRRTPPRARERVLMTTGDRAAIRAHAAPPTPAAAHEDADDDVATLERYLDDVRSALGADEVVTWRWSESAGELRMVAYATVDGGALRFPAAEGGPLVQWASREGIVVTDAAQPRILAAPVLRGDRLYGAIGAYAERGIARDRTEAKAICARSAAHVGALLELFETRRRALTVSARSEALLRAAEALGKSLDPAAIAEATCEAAREIAGAARAAYVSWDSAREEGRVERSTAPRRVPNGMPIPASSLVALVCREGRRLVMEEVDTLPVAGGSLFGDAGSALPPASLAIVPIVRHGESMAAIVVESDEPGGIGAGEGEGIAVLATIAQLSLEVADRLALASVRAATDGLTGLASRRAFDERLEQLVAESERYGQPVSLVLADLDNFKAINDSRGHDAGDEVLRHVGRLVQRSVRAVDLAARYGGEEIAILLPQTGLEGARDLAERLRVRLAAQPVQLASGEIVVTASFGVACFPDGVRGRGGLFAGADRALYAAKAGGRNRVSCWPEVPATL